ncbi:Protein transport protein sec20 [Elasticomyces elasticus]|uniref:Protein transport protein sec20 n=1 Tax=Exophiala sideris TaxID=1016849 RepID=A0ABR0JLL9_9EURO|nr:Protein transport protein sec20 [Elasticomyces elasticus]KAK5036419.1 Protein transport protein sec20 [Exophiala sideris]KAK5041749.1 Protein transport protein sec20 [Exophiala sideris]KAK5066803.1 Protein transport protein sec20 [Exophiala sideris]KAK5184861.1 Protein transport protein sec20 [Eurotiomycetes sp. CCFEE 6388]
MSLSLSQRLQFLADSYKETLNLIQELRKFSPASYIEGDSDDRRVELANEIHDSLKEQEDTLEILRQEFEDDSVPSYRRSLHGQHRDTERERSADLLDKLTEDLKIARASFRRAQLAAKRTADQEKRKEREQLFAARKGEGGNVRARPTHEKLTQNELALQGSSDVTAALRRMHNRMEDTLAQSDFAQQTLQESQEALQSLEESYSGTTDLLKLSRGLASQLVRSNKSDTWFLKSAFYMLAVTICWLFFRRLIYGPLILFVVWPIRTMWWFTMTSIGAITFGMPDGAITTAPKPTLSIVMPNMNTRASMPTHDSNIRFKSMEIPAKGGGWDRKPRQGAQPHDDESMVEKVGRMIDGEDPSVAEDVVEVGSGQDEQPRNTLKRMMEVEVESPVPSRDEL